MNCFAHTLNIAVRKGLAIPAFKTTLGDTKKLISYFHHSPSMSIALENQQEMLNLPKHKLKMDVETR